MVRLRFVHIEDDRRIVVPLTLCYFWQIRTPLHAVNGYCELLCLTNLTEEQKLYLSSIQQACHAINVIAGNVLGALRFIDSN